MAVALTQLAPSQDFPESLTTIQHFGKSLSSLGQVKNECKLLSGSGVAVLPSTLGHGDPCSSLKAATAHSRIATIHHLDQHDVVVKWPVSVLVVPDDQRDGEPLLEALLLHDAVFPKDHLHQVTPKERTFRLAEQELLLFVFMWLFIISYLYFYFQS